MRINDQLTIPPSELRYRYSRGGGPGGQNVNKVETRVTLLFDLENSPSLSDAQKERIRQELATRINREGILRVVSQKHRTQFANERAATERFVELIGQALEEEAPRRKTRVSAAARRRRMEDKKRHSRLKKLRRSPPGED